MEEVKVKEEIKEEEKKDEEFEKRTNQNFLWAFGIIVVIAAAFILTMVLYEPAPQTVDDIFQDALDGKLDEDVAYNYNGYTFVNVMGSWMTRIQVGNEMIEIPLHFGPREVENNITIVGEVDSRFTASPNVYVTFDPNSTQMKYIALSAAELSLNLAKGIKARPIAACTSNETACEGRPIVTCDSTDAPVIYIKKDKEPMLVQSGNCVILMGNEWDLVRVIDRFLLAWYGIMP